MSGLLTRWVPEKLKHSALYRWFLRFTRVLQFLSAIISLGLFSAKVYKIYRLVNRIKTHRGISGSDGAVEGILAAAVLYTIIAMIMTLLLRGGGPKWLRWIWVLFDLAFVGAFIAVSYLTRPSGGSAGPSQCYTNRSSTSASKTATGKTTNTKDNTCNLPWGTFVLAIVSTILHAITAAFQEVRDHHKKHRNEDNHSDLEERRMMEHQQKRGQKQQRMDQDQQMETTY